MALREFVDRAGVEWKVWSVAIDQVYTHGVRLETLGVLQDGWLCFEAPQERRRLASYPAEWFEMSEEELIALLGKATPVSRRRSGSVEIEPRDP
jgi:hypothetical protein